MMKQRRFILFLLIAVSFNAPAQTVEKVKVTDLEKLVRESKTPLIINFWATWCVPCVQELPYFQEEVKAHAKDSVRLVLVSLDFAESFPEKIEKFVQRKKIQALVYWLDETDADYFCPRVDPKWSGVIPATLFVNPATGYRNFHEASLSRNDLQKEITALLAPATRN